MLPGHLSLPNPQLLPMLHQAWLSRASTMTNNSMVESSPFAFPPTTLGGFHFPSPFFVPPISASSPDGGAAEKRRREENAEDLSFNAKRLFSSMPFGNEAEIICPICSIAVRREDLKEHFETEVKCLDNIRSLSPISQRPISPRSSRSYSTSPMNKSSSSISPVSPNHPRYENRWERFERIRNKRRERVGVRNERRSTGTDASNNNPAAGREDKKAEDEDIDIGDSLSDCGSHHSETESSVTGHGGAYGPLQYTEADVLRCLSGEHENDAAEADSSAGRSVTDESLMKCGSCRAGMKVPVLNVSCWHLKCEQCWLKSVGTSKSCSICSRPASVKDLRRVYA